MVHDKLSLDGKRIIITAGGNGIGRAMAECFASAGATVSICDISDENFKNLLASGTAKHAEICDVSNFLALEKYFGNAVKTLNGLDIIINNAGISGPNALIEDIDPEEWQRTIDVDLNGVFYGSKLAIPHLKNNGSGVIINISSSAAFFGYPNRSPYNAAKWALVGLTKTMAMELGRFNIRVNAICPGSVNGERIEKVILDESKSRNISVEEVQKSYVKHVSMGTFMETEDIANAAMYLVSDMGRYVSGQILGVDGHTESLSQH